MKLRDFSGPDHESVRWVIETAFGRDSEADLVEQLRQSGDTIFELVAEVDNTIAGHILMSKMTSPENSLALAPLSVLPDKQKQGVGSALTRAAIQRGIAGNWAAIFVLGNPVYYTRFGFSLAKAARFKTDYPKEYMMTLETKDGALEKLDDALIYAKPFLDMSV